MSKKEIRRERYRHDFYVTRFTLPVVKQMSEVMPGGFFIYRDDEKQELIYANRRVYELYGCKDQEEFAALTGNSFKGMVSAEDYERVQSSIDKQIDDEAGTGLDHVTYRIVRRDGAVRWLEDFGHYSFSPEYGDIYYVFLQDITAAGESEGMKKSLHRVSALAEQVVLEAERCADSLDEQMKKDIALLKEELEQARRE